MNNMINDLNVTKIVTILKSVTLTFSGIIPEIVYKQLPGEIMEKPTFDIEFINIESSYKKYKILYNWMHENIEAPLLVPNIDETFNPKWLFIKTTNSQVIISFDEYGRQNQLTNFYIITDEPLYFKAETLDGIILRNVSIKRVIVVNEENKYQILLTFNVNGAIVQPGTSKDYSIKLSIYKDYICSKYLGYIDATIKIINTTGPGE